MNTRNLAVYAQYVEKDMEKARTLLRAALAESPHDLFLRVELIEAENACGANADAVLSLYLEAPQEQRDTFLNRGMLAAYMRAGKWEEAADYLRTADRRYADTAKEAGWYDFCIRYADYLIDHDEPKTALEWLQRSRPNPENLTYVNYPEDMIYRHQELYLTGLAYKMLGDRENAEAHFRQTVQRPAEFYFFRPFEEMIFQFRFYIALAMKELDLEPAARSLLAGINKFRETCALVPLELDKAELKRWGESDPDSLVIFAEQTGPEI